VGMGLGLFDLIIIDEAHKSRGTESGLSVLIKKVIRPSELPHRLALTATPVELDVSQWENTLRRLGVDSVVDTVKEASTQYADAVKRVRQAWRGSSDARDAYKTAAARFQQTLSPYLLRRDKREDPNVLLFHDHSPSNEYRHEAEIAVETADLSDHWKKAICAAESLSLATRQANDEKSKTLQRLRLTLGNGHGIAAWLDKNKRTEDDQHQEQFDKTDSETKQTEEIAASPDPKRRQRAEWWLNIVNSAFGHGDEPLFNHPAIMPQSRPLRARLSAAKRFWFSDASRSP